VKAKELRQPIRKAEAFPAAVRVARRAVLVGARPVIAVHDAGEHSRIGNVGCAAKTGILQRMPRDLEEESQLGIHEIRFTW
jgi:hypothetical protein